VPVFRRRFAILGKLARSAFFGTNPKEEPITSGFPVIRAQFGWTNTMEWQQLTISARSLESLFPKFLES
jgi:hypothetical protein